MMLRNTVGDEIGDWLFLEDHAKAIDMVINGGRLGVLVINALRKSGVKGYRSVIFALLICILYALSDEIHQIFVLGRGAQVKDVIIDSAGASVGILVYMIASLVMHRSQIANESQFHH